MPLRRTRSSWLGRHWSRLCRGARRPRLQTEFSLHIDAWEGELVFCRSFEVGEVKRTLLQQDALQQGVLIPQHQTLICRTAVALLQALQGLLIALDRRLELTDILCTTLSESRLRLSVALLPFLGGSIDL